jgi:hypothetical protein
VTFIGAPCFGGSDALEPLLWPEESGDGFSVDRVYHGASNRPVAADEAILIR